VDIDKKNVHLPDGNAKDLREACRKYEQQIKAVGGIDLQVLGIGANGHIGFNEPTGSYKFLGLAQTGISDLTNPPVHLHHGLGSRFLVNKPCRIMRFISTNWRKFPDMLSPWVSPPSWNHDIVFCWQTEPKRPMPSEK